MGAGCLNEAGLRARKWLVEDHLLEPAWYSARSQPLALLDGPQGRQLDTIAVGDRFNLYGYSEVVGGDHYSRVETTDGRVGWVAAFYADPVE